MGAFRRYARCFVGVKPVLGLYIHLKAGWHKHRNVGRNSIIARSVQAWGWQNIRIGDNTIVSEGSWLNVNNRKPDKLGIIIGNSCLIGRNNYLSCGNLIRIGDFTMTNIGCHFLGSGHLNNPGDGAPYIAQPASEDGDIVVGVNCWIATGSIILKGATIGHGSVIGAGSMITGSIPPFSIVYGNPCRVKKRFDFVRNKWVLLENWSDELEQAIPDERTHLRLLRASFAEFQASPLTASHTSGDM